MSEVDYAQRECIMFVFVSFIVFCVVLSNPLHQTFQINLYKRPVVIANTTKYVERRVNYVTCLPCAELQ